MGELFFICGSVAGAALALLVSRGDRSRSMAAALTGVSCGLLGVLTSISGGAIAPMTQAGFGLLGAAAPLTLCVTSANPAPTSAGVWSVAGRYSAILALVLLYGTGCATAGFVSVSGLRHLSHKADVGDVADYSSLSPTYSGTPASTFPCRL